jgi:putative holliday junction resolvase
MRLLGIDYGSKRIGLALSDESGRFAFPHSVVLNSGKVVGEISVICRKEEVGKIVIGESLNFKGEKNAIMNDIEKFAEELKNETNLPVYFENEILTSVEASRIQGDNEMNDASAAALILKSYIDKTGANEI